MKKLLIKGSWILVCLVIAGFVFQCSPECGLTVACFSSIGFIL